MPPPPRPSSSWDRWGNKEAPDAAAVAADHPRGGLELSWARLEHSSGGEPVCKGDNRRLTRNSTPSSQDRQCQPIARSPLSPRPASPPVFPQSTSHTRKMPLCLPASAPSRRPCRRRRPSDASAVRALRSRRSVRPPQPPDRWRRSSFTAGRAAAPSSSVEPACTRAPGAACLVDPTGKKWCRSSVDARGVTSPDRRRSRAAASAAARSRSLRSRRRSLVAAAAVDPPEAPTSSLPPLTP